MIPCRWAWAGTGSIFDFTAKKGRALLNPRLSLSVPIREKWRGLVPVHFEPDWKDVWTPLRPRKEAAFLWSVYHRAVAVHQWRQRAFSQLSTECTCCDQGIPESLIHCFFACPPVIRAWDFVTSVLYTLAKELASAMPWPHLSWDQCLLGVDLPDSLLPYQPTWSILRGIALWTI